MSKSLINLPLINLPPDINETPPTPPLQTGKPTKNQAKALNYFAKTGRMPVTKEHNTEGTACFNLKNVPRKLLADIAVICEKHFPPENERVKAKTIGNFILEVTNEAVNRYKKKHSKYWESDMK